MAHLATRDGSPLTWAELHERVRAYYLTHDYHGWPLPPLTVEERNILTFFEVGKHYWPRWKYEAECSRLANAGYLEYVGATQYRSQERPWYRITARGIVARRIETADRLAGIQEEAS